MEENPELNAFRRQWREEVSRRTKTASSTASGAASNPGLHPEHLPPTRHELADRKDDDVDEDLGQDYGEFVTRTEQLTLKAAADEDGFQRLPQNEPRSALEHFEKAVEREAEGKLGDSLAHYRKAYKVRILY
jgi:F-box protein 9